MNPKEYWGRFRHLIRVLVIWLKTEEVTAKNKLRFLLSILLSLLSAFLLPLYAWNQSLL